MFQTFKQRSFEKTMASEIAKRDCSQINSEMHTLGFLVNEDTFKELDALLESYAYFGLQPKDVKVFTFVTYSKKAPSLRQNQVSNKDFSWKGVITNKNAVEFLDATFDVLVGYYTNEHRYLDMMMAKSKAKFKVGVSKANPDLYDLLIDVSLDDFGKFKTELKKYLTVLGKLKNK
ncbi:DUF6913 domain-containing protein [Jejudonia soesokkakensis]|uniref:DUF6913 domain-containing protein n=1 Tax=Jejudonia soesokkakensis TaxID=1323432 RepID=A0ABW2MXE6_9FLAO